VVADIGFYSGLDMFANHIFLVPRLIDMIHLYGAPDYIFFSGGCGGDVICFNLNFVYPRRGVLVAFESQDPPTSFRVLPTLPVVNMVYFQPPDFNSSLLSLLETTHFTGFMCPWLGFITINFDLESRSCKQN
jgi:hypothetical protein